MSGGVKFIFKTLISIPVIVTISYLILNIYGYAVSYFRVTALSYSVMQIVAENNYIPVDELEALAKYANSLETGILSDIAIVIGAEDATEEFLLNNVIDFDGSSNTLIIKGSPNNDKVQYGEVKKAGITAKFNWMNPFKFGKDSDIKVAGYKNTAKGGKYGIGNADGNGGQVDYAKNNMTIVYNVVGLRYYPDLE